MAHIRSVLTKVELEAMLIEAVRDSISRRKVGIRKLRLYFALKQSDFDLAPEPLLDMRLDL